MCKLRQRGRDFGGRAGSRGIDPSLQPLPIAAIAGAALYGRAASRTTRNLNPNSGPVYSACNIGVALFAGLSCICECPIFAPRSQPEKLSGQLRAPYFGFCAALKALSIAFVASKIAYCSVGDMPILV